MQVFTLCRLCGAISDGDEQPEACAICQSTQFLSHGELPTLLIAHLDCDSFYASVEKRDDPSLMHKPVIIGGEKRGVVSTACYVARQYGVRSAMSSSEARKRCPDGVFLRGNMEKYAKVGKEVREIMLSLTPLVEPISIDEAFMDLSGTETLHGGWPAQSLARLAQRIMAEIRVPVSIGLSYNKFLAKVASDLDKPNGFAVIGRQDAVSFLAPQPLSMIWGVGKAMNARLEQAGYRCIEDLQRASQAELTAVSGKLGGRLWSFSRGIDHRKVTPPEGRAKSVSSEVTLAEDLSDYADLKPILWRLCEKVASRLRKSGEAAGEVQLKLRTSDFRALTRSRQLDQPGQLAEMFFQAVDPLLRENCQGTAFRLIGFGTGKIQEFEESAGMQVTKAAGAQHELFADLSDQVATDTGPDLERIRKLERAMETVRDRFGRDSIAKGRGLK